ncbi:MAG: Holliday junction resolvase RuvX [Woeseiaceae bacterium]
MPDTPETILAFDFGKRRIGVAVGQQVTYSASALRFVRNDHSGPDWRQIDTLINDWGPHHLIVGMPINVDGSAPPIAAEVQKFIRDLARYELPIEAVDERYSSLEAEQQLKSERAAGLRGRITKDMVDSASAVLIAERWLKKEF